MQENASFGKRAGAIFVDFIASYIISSFIGYLLPTISAMIVGLIATTGFIYFCYQKYGATFGKSLFKIKAIDMETGEDLTPWSGVARESLGHSLSGLILGLGFIFPFFNKDARAFHDYIFKTKVIESQNQSV